MDWTSEEQERFWRKVAVAGDGQCRLWLGTVARNGYGKVFLRGRTRQAHRVAYEMAVGLIPNGLHVLHSCDRKGCVSPSHLRPGTHAENMREMSERGRAAPQRGETNNGAKLTRAQASEVRARFAAGVHYRALMDAFGISKAQVYRIARGHLWQTGRERPAAAQAEGGVILPGS